MMLQPRPIDPSALPPVMDPWMSWGLILLAGTVLLIVAFTIDNWLWRRRAEREFAEELAYRKVREAVARQQETHPARIGHRCDRHG